MRISARTRTFALLGNPVAHSLSPVMQNAGFRAAGLDAAYVAIACGAGDVAPLVRALAANGGGGNITVPHKGAAVGAGVPTARAARLGAANVFGPGADGDAVVHNTDVDGVLALVARLGVPGPWAILGTGGSARAAVAAAIEAGAPVAIRSRSEARARTFTEWAVGIGATLAAAEDATVAINATPLGLHADDPPPLALPDWPALRGVMDFTYRTDGPTALVALARARGLAAVDGREMLLVQGAAAWATWFPTERVEPPLEVMRAALAGRLG